MKYGYSTCHFAEVMSQTLPLENPEGISEIKHAEYCSFCGERCGMVSQPLTVEQDTELTLRRWKDGDVKYDQVAKHLKMELHRSWDNAVQAAANTLQDENEPMYILPPGQTAWVKTEEWLNTDIEADTQVTTAASPDLSQHRVDKNAKERPSKDTL